MPKKKILIVCPYPFGEAPSQRFRYEQYIPLLKRKGFEVDLRPFYSKNTWKTLYKKGQFLKKASSVFISFLKRIILLSRLSGYEFIFIHREATPIGPPFFEWFTAKVLKKRLLYDFDDAIWLSDRSEKGSIFASLKWKQKVKQICSWSNTVSCGNKYLADYALQYNNEVIINPTTIDTDYHRPLIVEGSDEAIPTVGWTGTHSTLYYLKAIENALIEVYRKIPFKLIVISNKEPELNLPQLNFIKWSKESEIEDLNTIDIGVMPLEDDEWSKGKCGFKALQFMACGKPVIASNVGVNAKIIDHSINGFLVPSLDQDEWVKHLKVLLSDAVKRDEIGKKGRKKIEKYYSVHSNTDNFLTLFNTNSNDMSS